MNDLIVLNLGHACTSRYWANVDISSPFVRICYVKSGRAVFHLKDGDMEFTAGNLYMLPSYTPHSYECDPGFDFYYMFVYEKEQTRVGNFDLFDYTLETEVEEEIRLLFDYYCSRYPQLSLPSRDADAFMNHKSYREYVTEYMTMEPYQRMQLHGLVEIVFSHFVRKAQPKSITNDKRIAAVLTFIHKHLSNTISVEQLADIACMTKSHLIRTFRQSLSVTPLQYVIRKKIQHAQALLLGSEMSIQEISQAIGIDDTSYFIRLFKKNLGFTPQEYREKLIG